MPEEDDFISWLRSGSTMQFEEALQYLLSLGHETLAIKLGLTNTERLLEALGNPQRTCTKVQIAGTNGKGSTAVMLDAMTRAAGISETALFTSPHLVTITERMRFNGQDIDPLAFAYLTDRVRSAALRLCEAGALSAMPTFFEHLTAMFLFACPGAWTELAILETGLGGRLDATTAAGAEVVAITPVALDHQEYLGETLEEIAAEKAAIIRPGVMAVIAPQAPAALRVILKRCADCEVVPHMVDGAANILDADETGRLRVTFETKTGRYENVRLSLRGRHQVTNAMVAIALAEVLRERGWKIPNRAMIEGLEQSVHAGRLDLRAGRPSMLFDGAHNAAGARALRQYLDEFIRAPITLVFGAMRDKDLKEIAGALFPVAERLILTRVSNPRAAAPETLAALVPESFDSRRITLAPSAEEALDAARAQTPPTGLICVTGSLYLVGEIMGRANS